MRLSDAQIGSTVQFRYDGGSRPGAIRQIIIEDIISKNGSASATVIGRDLTSALDANGQPPYRQYKNELAYDVSLVEAPNQEPAVGTTKHVSFVDVQQAVADNICNLPADDLAMLYNQLCHNDNADVVFDEDTGTFKVEAEERAEQFADIVYDYGSCTFSVMNVNGDVVVVGLIDQDVYVDESKTPVSPQEFVEILAKHLDN